MLSLVFVTILLSSIGIGLGIARSKYNTRVASLSKSIVVSRIDASPVKEELSKLDELKTSLFVAKQNIDNLDLPSPEQLLSSDDTQTSLDKLSRFYEKHNLTIAGSEQLILGLLPSSQLSHSLYAIAHSVPENIGTELFGNALSAVKEGLHPESTAVFFDHFMQGVGHMGPRTMCKLCQAIEHHNYASAIAKPLQAGFMEASGINSAGHEFVTSIKHVGGEMLSSAESCASLTELSSTADFDLTGHVPIVTIALSSFREFRLLSNDKTDVTSSLKNIALDVAGTGGGAAVGGKAGVAIGTAIAPGIGSLIGGIVGGVIGAVTGRFATNKVKMVPLKNAIDAYEQGYSKMQTETEEKSKSTLRLITQFANEKRVEFKESEILSTPPVVNKEDIIPSVALALYESIVSETLKMQSYASKLRESSWYTKAKHESIIRKYEDVASNILNQLPNLDAVKQCPEDALNRIFELDIPISILNELQSTLSNVQHELRTANEKNDASLLMWTYMINNLYQKFLNDIASYTNEQMASLNKLFADWKDRLTSLLADINIEKGKLGLS